MGRFRLLLGGILALSVFGGFLGGCDSRANEADDVQDAQKKLDEEKKDLANED